jgi:membrane fusion protein (multidrug efflux system)
MNKKIIKRLYNVVVIVFLAVAVVWCFSHFVHGSNVEYTDDAQVCRHITPINTRVPGFIKEIRFSDFQHVNKGDTLVIIEDSEFRLQVAQAEAGLRGSKAGSSVVSATMTTTNSNVQTASAGIEVARVDMQNAKQDFDRFAALMKKDAVTRQQYDNAYARYLAAYARYEQANSRKQSAASVKNVQTHQLGGSRAGESVAEAQLNLARLNLSYTVIVATCDGVVGKKDIHVGQLVQPGQMLARIVDDNDVWVMANYRETQMDGITVGKTVDFTADAIPDVVFHGKVEAISAAAGNAYSMIPVDNATGNFVKVEQRVPVRIALTGDNDAKQVVLLRTGLNVETKVHIK